MKSLYIGSDKPIKGGVIGKCKLCEEDKTLLLSHIVPKWCYAWMKKEGNGTFNGSYPSINVTKRHQDGNKHYMLCWECEQLISSAEKYCKTFLVGSDVDLNKVGINRYGNLFAGINLNQIQVFIYSIILKSHYAISVPFHNISISHTDIVNIRSLIKSPTDDDINYPISLIRYYSLQHKEIDPRAMIIAQYFGEENQKIFSIILAGWEWIIAFNSNNTFQENEMPIKNRVQNNQTYTVLEGDIMVYRNINPHMYFKKSLMSRIVSFFMRKKN